jgi:hypothetical protein
MCVTPQRYFVLGSDGCLRWYLDEEMQKIRHVVPLVGREIQTHFYANAR